MLGELTEAWRHWMIGSSTLSMPLWGSNVLWWGRLGKIVELVAGLTIVVEIIGVDRLQSFGRSLKAIALWLMLKRLISKSWQLSWRLAQAFVSEGGNVRTSESLTKRLWNIIAESPALFFLYSLCALGLGFWIFFGDPSESWSRRLYISVATVLFAWFPVVPAAFLVLVLLIAAAGFTLNTLVIQPAAAIMTRGDLNRLVNVASVLLLLAGFHFDLLAS